MQRQFHRGLAERSPRGRGGGQHGRRERHPHLLRHPPGAMVWAASHRLPAAILAPVLSAAGQPRWRRPALSMTRWRA